MSDLAIASFDTTLPDLDTTVWLCRCCHVLITIRCPCAVEEAFCPECVDAPLEFCGTFNRIPGFQIGDA